MYTLLVLSDSHGYEGTLSNVLMKATSLGKYDAVLHLGDGYYDLEPYEKLLPPIYQVGGNCDYGRGETSLFFRYFGVPIFMAHGHTFHVKQTLTMYQSTARSLKARIALYGHTHIQHLEENNDLMLLNPGAVMDGRFALLHIDGANVKATLY